MKLLKERNLLLLSIGQAVSLFGDRLNNMAMLALLGTRYAHSTFAFSGLAVFVSLPAILLAPFFGIITDKFDRRKLMIAMEVSRGVLVITIPLLFMVFPNIMLFYILVFLLYSMTVLYNNAKMAILPEIINEKRNIWGANAMLSVSGRIAIALGTILGGIIVELEIWKHLKLEGWTVGFFIDGLTYFFSAIMVALITLKSRRRNLHIDVKEIIEEEKSVLRKVVDDFKFALGIVFRKGILKLIFACIVLTMLILASVYNLYLPYIQQVLGYGTKGVGFMLGSAGLGLILGATFFSNLVRKFGEINSMIYGNILLASLLVLSIFLEGFIVYVLLFFLAGTIISPILLSYDTVIQRLIPNTMRGKIFSFREFVWSVSFLIFVIVLGSLGEFLKIIWHFELAIKVILMLSGTFVILASIILLKVWK